MPDKILSSTGIKLAQKVVENNPNKTFTPVTTPAMTSGGHLNANVAGGAVPQALAAQPCSQVTIANNTSVVVEVQVGGAGAYFPVFASSYYTFFGISDASQLSIRRVDLSASAITINARWEA